MGVGSVVIPSGESSAWQTRLPAVVESVGGELEAVKRSHFNGGRLISSRCMRATLRKKDPKRDSREGLFFPLFSLCAISAANLHVDLENLLRPGSLQRAVAKELRLSLASEALAGLISYLQVKLSVSLVS